MQILAGAGGVTAEDLNACIGIVRTPHAAGGNRFVGHTIQTFGKIHLKRLHGDAAGAIRQAGVQFILQRRELGDVAEAFIKTRLGQVLDMYHGHPPQRVRSFGRQVAVLVPLPRMGTQYLGNGNGFASCAASGSAKEPGYE